jgi:hypothetical protein
MIEELIALYCFSELQEASTVSAPANARKVFSIAIVLQISASWLQKKIQTAVLTKGLEQLWQFFKVKGERHKAEGCSGGSQCVQGQAVSENIQCSTINFQLVSESERTPKLKIEH